MFINKVIDSFDKTTGKIVVQFSALSLINYCISIWGYTNKTVAHSAQKLQNFAAIIAIGGARKYDHVLIEPEWMTIKHKYAFEKCSACKAVIGLYPKWVSFPLLEKIQETEQDKKISYMYKEPELTLAPGPLMCVDPNSGMICHMIL